MTGAMLIQYNALTIGFGVLALVAIGVLFAVLRKAGPPGPVDEHGAEAKPEVNLLTGRGDSLAALIETPEIDRTAFLSRYVVNAQGENVGETMGFHASGIVLKNDDGFFVVPATEILEKSGKLVATADIDWDGAKVAGAKWLADASDEMKYGEDGMPILDEKA